jgi:hypothetical protein
MYLSGVFVEDADIGERATDVAGDTNRRVGTLTHCSFSFLIDDPRGPCPQVACVFSQPGRPPPDFFLTMVLSVGLNAQILIDDFLVVETIEANFCDHLSALDN